MNNYKEIRKQHEAGKVFYLVAFSTMIGYTPTTASFLLKSDKEIPLIEVYLKIREEELLKEFCDKNGILTITNIQKL